ncbi:MAG: Asp-tRNA(Asn)/Glu-tRNA(Gln) amidotransferase GatCAB subunit B, partial [Zetaproteobacteria bacterium CG_4_8_14_3_um_filter_59_5]
MSWETVIGLEVHVQVNTNTKAFCGCSTSFGAEPNTQTCPVCLGMPGQLPVLNMEVARKTALTGLAINATINLESKFDRKNYFYPDLPKGYQISQFSIPIVEHGYLDIPVADGEKRIGVTRIHIEEDAGKSMHEGLEGVSHIDLNRSGVPLMEIVSEPDMRSADEAVAYLKQLHQLVRFLDVSGADMEKGQFRCDANVSVRRPGEPFGTRAELKNLNSFRFIKQAIEYEVARQIELIEDGGSVVQETRLYDSTKGESRSMRGKEEAHDYRYFPDPDLPPLRISQQEVDGIKAGMPELPGQLRARFESEFGLSSYDADVLSQTRELAGWY